MLDPRFETGKVLGYIWPKRTRCPRCGWTSWKPAGLSGGIVQYRRCDHPACGRTYKVLATHAHVDCGGQHSEVIALAT